METVTYFLFSACEAKKPGCRVNARCSDPANEPQLNSIGLMSSDPEKKWRGDMKCVGARIDVHLGNLCLHDVASANSNPIPFVS